MPKASDSIGMASRVNLIFSKNWNSGFQLRVILLPAQGTFGNGGRHFWSSQLGERYVLWASCGPGEARDAAKRPATPRAVPTTSNYLAQSVSNSEVEKPWVRGVREAWPAASSEFNSGADGGK